MALEGGPITYFRNTKDVAKVPALSLKLCVTKDQASTEKVAKLAPHLTVEEGSCLELCLADREGGRPSRLTA